MVTSTSRSGTSGRDYGPIALFIALVLVVGAVATWYVATDDDSDTTTTEVEAVAVPDSVATDAEAPARGGMAETWDAQSATPSEPIAVCVVDSEAAADRIRAALADADAIANSLGIAPTESRIVVMSPDADPYPMFEDERNFRTAEGLPDISVHDMRGLLGAAESVSPAESPDFP